MRSVLESTKGTKSFLSPGNFDTIKANNNVINEAKMESGKRKFTKEGDEFIEKVNVMSPSTHAEISDRNLTGKALIGVSANANAAHAIFQLASTLKLKTPFKFDTKKYSDLNLQYVVGKSKLITKVISETLAAFVDNGKDPQAKYSNINSYTIDVAMGMALSGIDLDTIQYFLSQEVIEDFTISYFNNGANVKAENLAKEEAALKLGINKKEFNIGKKNVNSGNITEFSTDFLKDNVATKLDSDMSAKLLKTFLIYKKLSKPISNLVTAVKIGEQGLGPSDSDNLYRLDQLEAYNFEGLEGAEELLNRTDLFPYHLNRVIENGRKLIIGDRNKGELYLPDRDTGAFYLLRQMFNNYKADTNLTVKEIEFINKNYLDYLASTDPFFAFDKNLIATISKNLSTAKDLNSNYSDKYSPLLNRLNLDVDKNNNITYIVYTGISGQDKKVVDVIRDTWESMLYDDTALSGDYKYSDLAKDLIKYSFMVAGFRISPQSFSHLQPVGFYTDFLPDFNKNMEHQIKAAEAIQVDQDNGVGAYSQYVSHFFHQFVRNHFRSLAYIPRADIENKSNIRTFKLENNKLQYVVIGNESNEFLNKDGEFVNYIKATVNKETVLLTLKSTRDKAAIYAPTEALGTYKTREKGGLTSGKMFTQYEFGTQPSTNFKQNQVSETKVPTEIPTESVEAKLESLWDTFKEKLTAKNPSMTYDEFRKGYEIIAKKKKFTTLEEFEQYLKNC